MARRSRSPSSLLIDANKNRPPPADARARMQERDQRLAADHRSEIERWLGDPPRDRSALAAAGKQNGRQR
jgi:hypothetical protein